MRILVAWLLMAGVVLADIDTFLGTVVDTGSTILGVSGCSSVLSVALTSASDLPGFDDTVAWYEFDEESGGGTNAAGQYVDSSAIGTNNATPAAGAAQPTWTAATNTISDYLSFDGGDYATVSGFDSLVLPTTNTTFSSWVNFDSFSDNHHIFKMRVDADNLYQFYANSLQNLRFYVKTGGTNVYELTSTNALGAGKWFHVVAVCDGAVGKLYVNGQDSSGSMAFVNHAFPSGSSLEIGGNGSGAGTLVGDLDDSTIWTNALTATQVDDLFWMQATNHGWSVFDYDNRTLWSNAVYVGTFEYDSPADTSPSFNNGAKAAGGAAPTFNSDTTNGWFGFDGGDYINFTSQVFPTGAKSWAFWIRCSDGDNTFVLDECNNSSAQNGDAIKINLGTVGTVWWASVKGVTGDPRFTVNTATTNLNHGAWVHVAGTWDGTTSANKVILYVNGVQDVTDTADSTESSASWQNLRIGASSFDAGSPVVAELDEIRIWSGEASSNDIFTLYNDTKHLYGL